MLKRSRSTQPRQCRGGDAGITLMELVVGMTLTVILSTMFTYFFVTTNRSANKSIFTNRDTGDARITLDRWTSMIRAAGWYTIGVPPVDRFEEITPTKIVFFANLNNRATPAPSATVVPGPSATTKVALMLVTTNSATGEGKLVEVVFGSDNTTPLHVSQVAFDAKPIGGVGGQAIFQPSVYGQVGNLAAPFDIPSSTGCYDSSTSTVAPGLCRQSVPAGAGMVDPTIPATGALVPTSGPLRGNASNNVDATLDRVASIKIAFSATEPSQTVSTDFVSSASVNSGVS